MSTFLGIVGFIVFIGCVIGVAAGMTWLVVKVSPAPANDSAKK